MNTILSNALILLPNRTILEGAIVINNGRITDIIKKGDTFSSDGAQVIDLSGNLIMPGLINCHGHTAMTLVRGLGSGLPLQRWLEEAIFPVEAKMTPKDVYNGTLWGCVEMLAGGTTCVADMYDFPEQCEEAFDEAGIKCHTSRVGLQFSENNPPNRLEECVKYALQKPSNTRLCRDICIHSEYLTSESFCRALAKENENLKRPVHVHISETEKEHLECIKRHNKTPISYLNDVGLLKYGAYAAHCVYCTDDDFRIMAEKNITLVHNPTSNMKLGSGFARILRARELGVNVALGTDGCASNDNLDLFEEMHLAFLIHKGIARDASVLSAWDVIEMATINGARALGRNDTGSIAVGNCADLCVVSLKAPHAIPCLDAANLVVNSLHSSDVVMTIVDGEILYDARGGQNWLRINDERLKFDFLSSVKSIMKK